MSFSVIAMDRRLEGGLASLAYVAAIPVFDLAQ
jgi:hypothetical protein